MNNDSITVQLDFTGCHVLRLERELIRHMDFTAGNLCLDLKDVDMVDPSGLRLLLRLNKILLRKGRKMILKNTTPAIEELLRLLRLDMYLILQLC